VKHDLDDVSKSMARNNSFHVCQLDFQNFNLLEIENELFREKITHDEQNIYILVLS